MYRFLLRPKWILFHVAVLAAAFGMLNLARWQWNKHLDRDAFIARVDERQEAEPAELVPLLDSAVPADIEYYRVTAAGSYLPTGQLIEINRTQDNVNGVNVLTPFQIDGGPIVIVNRGFVPDGTAAPPPPEGPLVVGGTARQSEARKTGELTDNAQGASTEVRRVDLPLIEERLGLELAPVYIDLIATQPPSPEPPAALPGLTFGDGPPHVSYTVQWCIFAVSVLVGWVFAIRRSLRTRRRAAAVESDATGVAVALSEDDPVQPSV